MAYYIIFMTLYGKVALQEVLCYLFEGCDKLRLKLSCGIIAGSGGIPNARYLLMTTNRTLEDIAEELGFSDAFHFSKSFKNNIGLSPKEFRESRHINQP